MIDFIHDNSQQTGIINDLTTDTHYHVPDQNFIMMHRYPSANGARHGVAASEKIGWFGATPVAGKTGWVAWTGTANRATKDTTTATLVDVAQTVKAIVDDLNSYGLLHT